MKSARILQRAARGAIARHWSIRGEGRGKTGTCQSENFRGNIQKNCARRLAVFGGVLTRLRARKHRWKPKPRRGKKWKRNRPVSRVLSRTVIPLRRLSPDTCSDLPGSRADHAIVLPYLVLLRVGFTVPRLLPAARCALTAPFHPCRFSRT